MMFIRYSLAAGAGGLFTGLCFYHLSKKHPFLISAGPADLDIEGKIVNRVNRFKDLSPLIQHGIPGFDCLRFRKTYLLSYDRRNRVPHWVMEHLTKDMFHKRYAYRRNQYPEDESIHNYFKSTNDDYLKSGYDKGHLAKADYYKRDQDEMDNTFILSNIAPQNPKFNRGIWRSLENHVKDLAKAYENVYVCSGPLYLPRSLTHRQEKLLQRAILKKPLTPEEESLLLKNSLKGGEKEMPVEERTSSYVIYKVIGDHDVAVPTHFFKIILCEVNENEYDMETYIIPNEKVAHDEGDTRKKILKPFLIEKDVVERAGGFLVFDQLDPSKIRRINRKNIQKKHQIKSKIASKL